jgi:hypothetical protein
MRHDDRQQSRQDEQGDTQISRALLQDAGGLGSRERVHHAAAECRTETFLTRALHEHNQDEKKADDDLEEGEDADEDVHGGREYGTR